MYEKLLKEAEQHGLSIFERPMPETIKGLYSDGVIWINKNLSTPEKICVLAEEIWHHHKSVGNILNQNVISNRKQEAQTRRWTYEYLIPLTFLIEAFKSGVRNQYELAEFLNVPESFVGQALQHYKSKYGLYKKVGQYTIQFEPLLILELCE